MKKLTALACLASLLAIVPGDAALVQKTVPYRSADGALLEGYAVYDSSWKQNRPLVLIFHDWDGPGSYERMRAEMLARLGYVAFVADIYGKGVRPQGAKAASAESGKYYKDPELLRTRAKAALNEALKLPKVGATKVGAIGYCFGGSTALELARTGAPLVGVVSFHGGLATQLHAAKGTLRGQVLALHGAADPFVPPAEVEHFKSEMENAGAKYRIVQYPGAVHAFTIKGSEKLGLKGAAYNAEADRKSWIEMKTFFRQVFGR